MQTVSLVGRLLISLAFVLGLMWLLARRMKRTGRSKNAGLIDVLGRQQLSRGSSITVVRVAGKALILGVTDGQVSVLGDAELAELGRTAESPPAAARAARGDGTAAARSTPTRTGPAAASGVRSDIRALGVSADPPGRRGPLAGSALSPNTWRQTLESLRELTARSR